MKNFLFCFLFFISTHLIAQSQISITYIGNMGVLISDNTQSVLIDGLHEKYGDDYLFPPENLVDKITNGNNGYATPLLLLYTHMHGDHFNGKLTDKFTTKHPQTIIMGAKQVINTLKLSKNTKSIHTLNYNKQLFSFPGFSVKAFKMDHAGNRHKNVENVAYIVNIGDEAILHVGDSTWHEGKDLWELAKIKEENISTAILPYWMLLHDEAEKFTSQFLSGARIIATHISPRIQEKDLIALKKRYPKIVFLTTLEEHIKL